MTTVFAVVGQHRAEPGRLLLLGDDGRYYAYAGDGPPTPVEPTAAWLLDEDDQPAESCAPEAPGARGRRRRTVLAFGVGPLLLPGGTVAGPSALPSATASVAAASRTRRRAGGSP